MCGSGKTNFQLRLQLCSKVRCLQRTFLIKKPTNLIVGSIINTLFQQPDYHHVENFVPQMES
jgi:hypothetical protein